MSRRSAHCRGFTLLEMMMVILLTGVIASSVIMTLPAPAAAGSPLATLLATARWASDQAQREGRIYRLRITKTGWQLAVLSMSAPKEDPLADAIDWRPVRLPVQLPEMTGELRLAGDRLGQPLPAWLWFMPEGEVSPATLEYHPTRGPRQQLRLGTVLASRGSPE
ncbi:prepilin-type N-terminal cleavage/methylation domain-containing protein [Pantoea sp. 1.19]|uniref:prepilin-type N-terminal cleavage/methylation domain-containing protein n=1 Tax=Pantoea sp. 1.19 TaxID=1925589 RepID=UPI000948B683|nr:prepilin-type N-terminal cleavage/methylation domain-containing protein [Pantoea sp. 1.19]